VLGSVRNSWGGLATNAVSSRSKRRRSIASSRGSGMNQSRGRSLWNQRWSSSAAQRRCGAAKRTALLGVRHEVVQEHRAGEEAVVAIYGADHVGFAELAAVAVDHDDVHSAERFGISRPGDVDRLAGVVDDADVLDHLEVVAAEGGDAADRLAGAAAFEHPRQL